MAMNDDGEIALGAFAGACYQCGLPGHCAKDCSKNPKSKKGGGGGGGDKPDRNKIGSRASATIAGNQDISKRTAR